MSPIPMNVDARASSRRGPWIAVSIALALLGAAIIGSLHVGFQASDDIHYLNGALGWIDGFPYVGDSHWTLRHTITLPTAFFVQLFGLHEWAVSLSNIVYFCAFLALNFYFVRRFLGGRSAALTTLLLLLTPGFPVVATYLNPDIPELFFVSSAFWALLMALEHQASLRWWVIAGAFAGLGFINRETAAAFVLFATLLCGFRPGAPRMRYLPMAAAFVAVLFFEWLYLMLMTGNPLYRVRVDFHHSSIDRFAEFAGVAAQGRWIDNEGNLSVNVFLDPVINLFVSQKYALLFWLAVPAAVFAWRHRQSPQAHSLLLLAALGLTFFIFIGANPKLLLVPRYFIDVAWVAAVLGGWGLARLWEAGRTRLAAALTAAAVLAGLAALSVENVNPRMVERALVQWVQAHPGETVYTDIETRARSEFYFRFAGVSMDRVIAEAPPKGALFFHSASRVATCAAMPRCKERAGDFRPQANWKSESTISGPRKPAAWLAGQLGLGRLLPQDVAQRVLATIGEITLYRIE